MDILRQFYSDEGPERCGLILTGDVVIETENVAEQPTEAFEIPAKDLIENEDRATASWHTHPGGTSQLSFADFEGFLMWPDLKHYIVGKDSVTCYVVKNGAVVIDG